MRNFFTKLYKGDDTVRKILCTTLAILMLLSTFAVMGTAMVGAAETESETLVGIIGDADKNGNVNVSDATFIQKELAENFMFDSIEELLADVDENDSISIKDATQIQKHIAECITDSRIGEKLHAVLDFVGTVVMDAIEIEYDENGNVTRIIAGSIDTMAIKAEFEALIGMSCEEAMEIIVSALAQNGFFGGFVDGEKETFIVQVSANSEVPHENFAKDISRKAQKTADRHHCKPEFVGIDKDDYCTSYDEAYITLEKAQEIALTFFGVWAQDATFIETEYDIDDGTPFYELEFIANGWKFECDVNAVNGRVCESEKEKIRDEKPATPDERPDRPEKPATPDERPDRPQRPSTHDEFITLKEAMNIALSHAGVSTEDAKFEDRDFDVEDGTPYYELEFVANGYRYEYDIHAVTGAILNFEFEPDDERPNHPDRPDRPGKPATFDELISEEEAIEKALRAAGITECEYEIEVELERTLHGLIYEVEVETAKGEYEIEIDAVTGSIIGFECEFEDGHHHGRPEDEPQNKPADFPYYGGNNHQRPKKYAQ